MNFAAAQNLPEKNENLLQNAANLIPVNATENNPESDAILEISEIAPRICTLESDCKKTSWGQNSFVEIYNPTAREFLENDWKIQYASATGENFSPKNWENIADITEKIAPYSYLVVPAWPGNGADGFLRIINQNGEIIDQVGYGKANFPENSAPKIKSNFSAQRCEKSEKSLETIWILSEKITPGIKTDCEILTATEDENSADSRVQNNCENLRLNEIGANLLEQFIEIKNISAQEISLAGCQIATNRGDAKLTFSDGEILRGGAMCALKISETDLTLTKTTSGEVFILNSNGDEVDSQKYANLKANTSFAKFADGWRQTFSVTAGKENIFQKFPSCENGYFLNQETGRCKKNIIEPEFAECPAGYERNPVTNRCRKVANRANILTPCPAGYFRNPETNRCKKISNATKTLTLCPAGYFRNPETNRCKKIATTSSKLKACPAGYFRNPETNRCKKISSGTENKLKPCAPGYERNPKTNRCRKIAVNSSENAKFALEEIPASESQQNFYKFALLLIALGFLLMLILQYRFEIGQFFAKISDHNKAKNPEKKSTKNLENNEKLRDSAAKKSEENKAKNAPKKSRRKK